jgi:hypothetical protein
MRFAFSEICQEVSKCFGVVALPTTFQIVSVVCQIFLLVPHQTHEYQAKKAVVEHKGLLRGCGWSYQ